MEYPEAGDMILRLGTPEDVLVAASCILTKSGTTVLEAAWTGTPMVVAYRSSWSTFAIARRLMTVRWIGLVNLILGAEVVPEFWRPPVRSADLATAIRPLLRERSAEAERQRQGFASVREALGHRNAADAVAGLSLELFRV
jgi:lipid-A-disaccharide synthase